MKKITKKDEIVLRVGEIYSVDMINSKCPMLYMGRLGFEFNLDIKGVKGAKMFRPLDTIRTTFVWLTSRDLVDIKLYEKIIL